ncbi:MAG: tyrosine-type recombinase/integrase [Comamonadaceae bacterium]|nr:tyrosine-type recombinase/integrase [Comamonadaceae bacterium]
MGYGHHLVRRENGVYVCRFVVPESLRKRLARTEIRISTGSWHRPAALSRAQMIVGAWRAFVVECGRLDQIKAIEAAPFFAGHGDVLLVRAAEAVGMDASELASAVTNRGGSLIAVAANWPGADVRDVDDLEREDGEYTWASVEGRGEPFTFNGRVLLEEPAALLDDLRTRGTHHPYRVSGTGLRGHGFVQPRSAALCIEDLWVRQADVEGLRLHFVRTHAQAAAARAQVHPAPIAMPAPAPARARVSALVSDFLSSKGTPQLTASRASWKPDELERNQQKLRCFVELLGDPALSEVEDGVLGERLVRKYIDLLRRMPTGPQLRRARRETGEGTALALVEWADRHEVDRMLDSTVNNYLMKLSECFAWGVARQVIKQNPLHGQLKQVRRLQVQAVRDDEQRPPLPPEDLEKIFAAPWFAAGGAPVNRSGKPSGHFRPFYYWIPLLALYAGGRANELAQLYLEDIDDADSVPSICFQLTHPDQMDEDGQAAMRGDQSLKTRNARREVPIHPQLLALGFLDYVAALRAAGHQRLFPELRYDARKGYSKDVVKWFNERFLGIQLGMVRDGTKTLHSLRHNFATALKDPTPQSRIKRQLLGHERGENLADKRYTGDATRLEALEVVRTISVDLPPTCRFDAQAAVRVLQRVLRSKAASDE